MDITNFTIRDKISKPVIFLVLSIIFSFINNFAYGGGISSILIFIVGFFITLFFSSKKIKLNKMHIVAVLFWIVISISTVMSHYVNVKQDIFTFLIAVIFFILATSINYNNKEIKCILLTYVGTTVVASINIIYNLIIDHQFVWNRYSTSFFGVDKDPNYASAFMVPSIIILLFSIMNKKNSNNKLFYLFNLILITFAAVSTGSRAAFLFVAFCYLYSLFVFVIRTDNKFSKKILIFIVVIIILLFSLEILVDLLPESLISRVIDVENYTDSTRLGLWEIGLRLFENYPLLGVGLNGGNIYILNETSLNSHNVYLDILLASGILGTLLFIGVLLYLTKGKRGSKLYILGLMGAMLGPLFFINGFNTPSFWTPLMILGIIHKHSYETELSIYEWI